MTQNNTQKACLSRSAPSAVNIPGRKRPPTHHCPDDDSAQTTGDVTLLALTTVCRDELNVPNHVLFMQ